MIYWFAGCRVCGLQPVVAGAVAGHVPAQLPAPPRPGYRYVRRPPSTPRARHAQHHRVPDAQV